MEKKLISIIMPCLNVEDTIEISIQSVLNQTIINQIEIIVVDGGSTDRTLEIINKKFGNKVTLLHSKRKGIPSQVCLGAKASKGDYIGFVDTDDYVDPKMYEILLSNLSSTKSDVSCCKMKHSYITNQSFLISYNQKIDKNIKDPYVQCRASRCNKLIKRDMVLRALEFYNDTSNVNNWEDSIFTFSVYSMTNKIVDSNLALYTYCRTPKSSSRKIKNDLNDLDRINILCNKYSSIYNKWHNPLYYRLFINPFQSIYLICLQARKDKFFYCKRKIVYKTIRDSETFNLIYNNCPFDESTECMAGRKDVTMHDYSKFLKILNKRHYFNLDIILLYHGFKKIFYKLMHKKIKY